MTLAFSNAHHALEYTRRSTEIPRCVQKARRGPEVEMQRNQRRKTQSALDTPVLASAQTYRPQDLSSPSICEPLRLLQDILLSVDYLRIRALSRPL